MRKNIISNCVINKKWIIYSLQIILIENDNFLTNKKFTTNDDDKKVRWKKWIQNVEFRVVQKITILNKNQTKLTYH